MFGADTDFLLQVLRTAKFSQLRAREIIENILTMKTKLPKMMSNLDSHDPTTLAFIERGYTLFAGSITKYRVNYYYYCFNLHLPTEVSEFGYSAC
jgi:hypothetical protein